MDTKAPKNGRSRSLKAEKVTLEVVRAQREIQDRFKAAAGPGGYQDKDLIFAQPDGRALPPDTVTAAISRLCRQLKFPKGTGLHSLRHGYASQRIKSGDNIIEVSRALGHRDASITLRVYGHLIPGSDQPTGWADFQRKHGGIVPTDEQGTEGTVVQ